jgi:hypothetical protein
MLKILLEWLGKTYSEELGINLKSGKSSEIFKWFVASLLFGARIGETIARKTYQAMVRHGYTKPEKILKADIWDLIKVMGEGGYVRYDGKTSNELQKVSKQLIEWYGGNLNNLHSKAKDARDLEQQIQKFYSVGPVTCNIFLRELRGIWRKADPDFSPFVMLAAKKLGITNIKKYWQKNKISGYDLRSFEAALLRWVKIFVTRKNVKFAK